MFEGYCHYKMITLQGVPSGAQVKRYFNFIEKSYSVLEIFNYSEYSNQPIKFQICDVTMSINLRESTFLSMS